MASATRSGCVSTGVRRIPSSRIPPPAPPVTNPDALERIYEWMKLNQDLSPDAETWMSVAKGTSKGASHGD